MNCHWLRKRFSAFLSGELGARGEAARKHLATCPLCREQLREVEGWESSLRAALKAVANSEALRADEVAAIVARLRAEAAAPLAVARPAWSWLGVVVVCLLALMPLVVPQWAAPAATWFTPAAREATIPPAVIDLTPSSTPLPPSALSTPTLPGVRAGFTLSLWESPTVGYGGN